MWSIGSLILRYLKSLIFRLYSKFRSGALFCYFSASLSDSGPIQAVKEVKVVDIGVKSIVLSWRKTPGVSGYKISWTPFLGEAPYVSLDVYIYI